MRRYFEKRLDMTTGFVEFFKPDRAFFLLILVGRRRDPGRPGCCL
jgi:hypothetical protein